MEQSWINSDAELWAAVRRGDIRAFEAVVSKHQSAVAAVAYSITGDFNTSEDVAQECFWQAYRGRDQLRETQRLGAWLCGIARNVAHSVLRKKNRLEQPYDAAIPAIDEQSPDPISRSISAEESQLIWNALQDIPDTYREVLILYYRQGESVADVAEHLDISADAVKQRLSRGREYLRSQLSMTIEGILQRTRPSGAFTTRVMTGIAALTVSLKASGTATAAAATTTAVATSTAAVSTLTKGGTATSAWATLFGGGMAGGIAGGIVGFFGGLGGAFLGTWVPAQMATAQDEHEVLRKSGRKTFIGALAFSAAIMLCTPLVFVAAWRIWYFVLVAAMSIAFTLWTIRQSLAARQQIHQLQRDPNRKVVAHHTRLNSLLVDSAMRPKWRGLRYRSNWKVFGVPLLDIQFGDPGPMTIPPEQPNESAWGWIAFGDRAVGILLAIGGTARGLFAFGGMAFGAIAGGGLAVGFLAMGGLGIGLWAIGGLAIGYEAVGGGALGWHSAAGGAAAAYHVAIGGGAVAHDFAVGGSAWAVEANTQQAREVAANESGQWLLETYIRHAWLANTLLIAISLLPVLLMPFVYRRKAHNDSAVKDETLDGRRKSF